MLLNLLARAFIVLTIETTSFKASIKQKIQFVHIYVQHIAPRKHVYMAKTSNLNKMKYRRPSDNSHKLKLQHMVGIGINI